MNNLLSLTFWFSVDPIPLRSTSFKLLLGLFLLLVIAGIVTRIVGVKKRKEYVFSRVASRLTRPLVSTGIVGLVLIFFEYERVLFLSSRFWYVLLFAWFVYSIARFVQYVTKKLPAELAELERKTRLEKYLPR